MSKLSQRTFSHSFLLSIVIFHFFPIELNSGPDCELQRGRDSRGRMYVYIGQLREKVKSDIECEVSKDFELRFGDFGNEEIYERKERN